MSANLQNQINKDCIISAITSMLNVRFEDALTLMANLDTRLMKGTIKLFDCSFQVVNGYKLYYKYLELVDENQFKKRVQFFKNVL